MMANPVAFPQDESACYELFSKLNGNLFKFLRMIEIDKYFNLESNSTDS